MASLAENTRKEERARPAYPTAIVGLNPILRESLSRYLLGSSFDIVSLSSSVEELAHCGLPIDQGILVIIDACDHPGELCRQVERFHKQHPLARIVVLANRCAPSEVTEILGSGAHGYFATIATCEDFIKSLELVMNGQTIIPSECVSPAMLREVQSAVVASLPHPSAATDQCRLTDASQLPQFSERELFILRCLTDGSSNKVIARECDIAEGTVKVHVKAILRKIKVSNRTQAAIWALINSELIWREAPKKVIDSAALQRERPHQPRARSRDSIDGGGASTERLNGTSHNVEFAS